MKRKCGSWIPVPTNFSVSTFAKDPVGIASRTKIAPRKCRCVRLSSCGAPSEPEAQIGIFCHSIYQREGDLGIRRILGVLSLAKKYGIAALEDACTAALEMGISEYRFVRRYLDRRPQPSLRQIDPLIRELTEYRDFINLKTKEEQSSESD